MDELHDGEYRWTGPAVMSLLTLAVLAAIALAVIRPDFSTTAVATSDTPPFSAPTGTVAPSGTAPPDTATTTTLPQIGSLLYMPGLKCTDLKKLGKTYPEVVAYWNGTGQPDSLDQDGNGAPCETVYPKADVIRQFGDKPFGASTTTSTSTTVKIGGIPSGLTCGQLRSRGVDVGTALDYYVAQGSPTRMDADGNGIPCETVYSDAAKVWRSRKH
ncbi:MAG: excalibur calcium-binding domain-containing protein [Acidimicrobiales bacterium]